MLATGKLTEKRHFTVQLNETILKNQYVTE
jgi:hypothetical protein